MQVFLLLLLNDDLNDDFFDLSGSDLVLQFLDVGDPLHQVGSFHHDLKKFNSILYFGQKVITSSVSFLVLTIKITKKVRT